MTLEEKIFLTIGIFGALCVLFAFFQQTRGKWTGAVWQYELFNFVGAFCLFIYAMKAMAYPTIILNFVWCIIALVSLWHIASGKVTRLHHHKKRKGS